MLTALGAAEADLPSGGRSGPFGGCRSGGVALEGLGQGDDDGGGGQGALALQDLSDAGQLGRGHAGVDERLPHVVAEQGHEVLGQAIGGQADGLGGVEDGVGGHAVGGQPGAGIEQRRARGDEVVALGGDHAELDGAQEGGGGAVGEQAG